jgi:hypothetical protein
VVARRSWDCRTGDRVRRHRAALEDQAGGQTNPGIGKQILSRSGIQNMLILFNKNIIIFKI